MTLEKAVSEHHSGALVKIQAWRRDDCAIRLHNSDSTITLPFVLFANQATPVGLEEIQALIQCVRMDSVRPSGWDELTLRGLNKLCFRHPCQHEVVCGCHLLGADHH